MRSNDQTIIDEAKAALPEIIAQLEPKEQPATGAWVAFTVRGRATKQTGEAPVIHQAWYTWRHPGPLEEIDEATYKELTLDPKTGKIKVPAWLFELEPLGIDEWWLNYWFSAPLRLWAGESVGDRVRGYGVSFRAWREGGQWRVEVSDILAS
jgi:hypothetical protein